MRSVRMPSQVGLARLYKGLFAFSLAMLCTPVLAKDASGLEPLDLPWLQKVHKAARDLDYSGVIIYTQDQASQSMKLVHIIDGTGERERLEILDGEPREFLRQNEVTQCLIPEKKMVVIERRENERFPSFLVGDVSQLPNFYDMRRLPSRERVAGRPCDLIELVPKDDQRYGYRVCADTDHHLLLKMQTLDPQQAVVDQIAFASVAFGEQVDLQELRTSWNPSKWEVVEPEVQKIDLSEQGWHLALPAGFTLRSEMLRPMRAGRQVTHLMVSDGLAAISVFLEKVGTPEAEENSLGAFHRGSMNMYRSRINDYVLTSTGAVPVQTLRALLEGTQFTPLSRTH